MLKRKGEGLSFTVLVVAILALVVLVVMIVVFSQKTGKSVGTLESCESRSGTCKVLCDSAEIKIPEVSCPTGQTCCLLLNG